MSYSTPFSRHLRRLPLVEVMRAEGQLFDPANNGMHTARERYWLVRTRREIVRELRSRLHRKT